MSLNQILNPSKPLNAVFNSIASTNGFVDTRTSVKPDCSLADAGIQSIGITFDEVSNINYISRSFNDPLSGLLCQEVFIQFTSSLLAGTVFNINYLIPTNSTVIYSDASLVKPVSPLAPTEPNLNTSGVFTPVGPEIININFYCGVAQLASPTSKVSIHFIFSFP